MRLPYFAIIWFVYMILAGISMFETSGNFIVLLVLTIGAVAATAVVMEETKVEKEPRRSTESVYEKAKRSSENPSPENALNSGLLTLLDDSDREALRQQIMERLTDHVDHSSDGELNTLEALLAQQGQRTRR